MRLESFMCLGGMEISNHARTAAYVNNSGLPGAVMSQECACYALDEGFDLPTTDPAPWYEVTRPESADFYGFYASESNLQPVFAREVNTTSGYGSVLSPLKTKTRILTASGMMLARTAEGMAYGERWLSEVLRGSPCADGDCASDSLTILPACPESVNYDAARYFRSLMNVGVVDGPVFIQIGNLPECKTQQVSFTIAASMPFLYLPAERCLDQDDSTSELSCSLTTPDWMGDGTFVIDITNLDTVDVTGINIEGRISLDGSCPVTGLGRSVAPSYSYTIPLLGPGDRISIDGARRQALYYDASCKQSSSALPYVEFAGRWKWPDVGPCTTMCLTIVSSGGETGVTVDTYLREL